MISTKAINYCIYMAEEVQRDIFAVAIKYRIELLYERTGKKMNPLKSAWA